ncbi:MAG: tryptophan synthase subunit alpha [Planctomycetota bacterium]|jgi:tryptophan synthase alpha chain|nr:tryptophan synthase subunit alpha [Planctomycetota bacterium]
MPECLLMAHLVAGYPDMERSVAVAKALARGGADYLEVQFPFSDPTADGPTIERACQAALANGFKVDGGFAMVRRLAAETGKPVFIMTYGSIVFARGAAEFARLAAEAGATGLVVPDLPPDYDENLFAAGAEFGLAVTPVIAPETTPARLGCIGSLRPEYIYTALRLGVTGSETSLDDDSIRYLDSVSRLGAKTIAGFGVRSRGQMEALAGHAHAAAVGSHFLDALAAAGPDFEEALAAAAGALKGNGTRQAITAPHPRRRRGIQARTAWPRGRRF